MAELNGFMAGVAQVDITPALGTVLGVDMTSHYARFIHDPIYSKALVLTRKATSIVLVIVDICIMDTDLISEIKDRITIATGISYENILLACNHNHAAANVVGYLGSSVDLGYRKKLPAWIVESVTQAVKKTKPAKMAYGSILAPEFVVSRRYFMQSDFLAQNPVSHSPDKIKTNPFGAEDKIIKRASVPDPEVCFIAIKGIDDQWITVLANYGLHYAADWKNDSVTGDYFGQFAKYIKQYVGAGDDFVGIMSNGTSGDINIWDFVAPDRLPSEELAKSKLIGETIALRVANQIENIQWINPEDLKAATAELTFTVRKPTADELAIATKNFIASDFDDLNSKSDAIQRIYDREQLLLNEYPDQVELATQVFKIGNVFIGALPGEFFAETGMKLKKDNSPHHYFSISLANSYGGYICPEHEYALGGYETWRARSSFIGGDAEARIRNKINELISTLSGRL